MRLLTAIPVYNEESHIDLVLPQVLLKYAEDVLVVDDGSTDGTPERLRRHPVRVVRHERNLGYGAGLKSAFQYTVEHGYDGLVTLDCDGQHEPALIPAVAAPLDRYDIVSGSRYLCKRVRPDPAAARGPPQKINARGHAAGSTNALALI